MDLAGISQKLLIASTVLNTVVTRPNQTLNAQTKYPSARHRERPEGVWRSMLNNILLCSQVVLLKDRFSLFWIATSPSALRNDEK